MNTPHKCLICDGTGLVSRPPGVAGDQMTWGANGTSPYDCGPCKGTGVLWQEKAKHETCECDHAKCCENRTYPITEPNPVLERNPSSFTDGPRVGGCRADRIPFGDLHFYAEEKRMTKHCSDCDAEEEE